MRGIRCTMLQLGFGALLGACALAVSAAITPPPEPLPSREPVEFLIRDASGALGVPTTSRNPLVERSWRVEPAVVALAKGLQRPVRMPIPDGRSIDFAPDRFEMREGFAVDDETGEIIISDDPNELSYYWHGSSGRDHLAITVVRGTVAARLHTPAAGYSIQREGREHQYRSVNMALLNRGACKGPITGRELAALTPRPKRNQQPTAIAEARATTRVAGAVDRAASAKPSGAAAMPKYTVHIDLLFYYTDQAALLLDPSYDATSNPGPALALLQARAQQYIDEVNQTLQNSGIAQIVTFHQVGPVTRLMQWPNSALPYDEGQTNTTDPLLRFQTHLAQARNIDTAGPSPPWPPNRGTYGADVAVVLLADMGDPNASPPLPRFGAAYFQNSFCAPQPWGCGAGINVNYGPSALGVISIAEETQRFTFSHEIGHMLGADHDYVPPGESTWPHEFQEFSHSYGYRVAAPNPPAERGARDVMADPWCGTSWNPAIDLCPRAQLYSNPEIFFPGLIGGVQVAAGTVGGRTCFNPRATPAPGNCPPTSMAARTVAQMAGGTAAISTGIWFETPFFWDSLEEFCDAPVCPTW